MFKKVSLAVLLASCLVWAGCSDGGSSAPASSSSPSRRPPPAQYGTAPSRNSGGVQLFTLPMVDGRQVSVQGPTALFFFTTWCGSCKQVLPHINSLISKARARGWSVYGIDVQEDAAQVNGFLQQYQPAFPVLLDQQGVLLRQYGIRGYPTFVLIDETGKVIYNRHEMPRNF